MNSNFNKNDYIILESLIGNECITPFRSLTVKYLVDNCKFSHVKIRQTIKTFQIYDYVKEGSRDGNTKTYYVTNLGVKHYMEVMDYNEDDISELIEQYRNKREDNDKC